MTTGERALGTVDLTNLTVEELAVRRLVLSQDLDPQARARRVTAFAKTRQNLKEMLRSEACSGLTEEEVAGALEADRDR